MFCRLFVPWLFLVAVAAMAQQFPASWRLTDTNLAAYFAAEVGRIESRCLADVQTLGDWTAQREERCRQLFDMLGLWPLPPRTELKAVVTGTVDADDFTVEKLHFQSQPGLYVTGNLYLPRNLAAPAPAILYVCGHAQVKTNDISYGNKTAYQHHAAWFARHGYVCLTIDTLQLGEIQGDHHGTYRLGQWWWNSRGYTPAGVEAWNCIRALDYLETRPEVDRQRIGMTGRSGGGSYTWTTAALDDRVKVAAPVAGLTDLRNQVLDGAVEGHCDCMFFINTHRWDFALNAALIAPRPLLIVNTDADNIFPLDGVQRIFAKTRRLYELHEAYDKLGLVIGPGPHQDSQNLQVPVFRWFNRHLKGEDPVLTDAAEKPFTPDQLRVFDGLPADQRNTRIQEIFGAPPNPTPTDLNTLRQRLRELVFRGWPDEPGPLALREVSAEEHAGVRLRVFEFLSQPHVPLLLFVADRPGSTPMRTRLQLLDDTGWTNWLAAMRPRFGRLLAGYEAAVPAGAVPAAAEPNGEEMVAWLAPRGTGPHAWPGDERKQVQLRRRFQLLGQTVDGMRVWDIRRGLRAVQQLSGRQDVLLAASGRQAVSAVFSIVFEDTPPNVELDGLPKSFRDEPDFLNIARVTGTAHALDLVRQRTRVMVK